MCVCVCVCVCVVYVSVYVCSVWPGSFFFFCIILYGNCFGRTVLYMCIKYHILLNMSCECSGH